MATKRNDEYGYKRGAKSISGDDGGAHVKWGKPEGVCKVTGSDGGPDTKSWSTLQKEAKGQ